MSLPLFVPFCENGPYIGLGSVYCINLFVDILIITVYDHQVMNKAIRYIGLFINSAFRILCDIFSNNKI